MLRGSALVEVGTLSSKGAAWGHKDGLYLTDLHALPGTSHSQALYRALVHRNA